LMFMGQFLGLGDDEAGEIVLRTKWAVAAEKQAEQEDLDRTILLDDQDIKRKAVEAKAK
jgi:hypothetical protein